MNIKRVRCRKRRKVTLSCAVLVPKLSYVFESPLEGDGGRQGGGLVREQLCSPTCSFAKQACLLPHKPVPIRMQSVRTAARLLSRPFCFALRNAGSGQLRRMSSPACPPQPPFEDLRIGTPRFKIAQPAHTNTINIIQIGRTGVEGCVRAGMQPFAIHPQRHQLLPAWARRATCAS